MLPAVMGEGASTAGSVCLPLLISECVLLQGSLDQKGLWIGSPNVTIGTLLWDPNYPTCWE